MEYTRLGNSGLKVSRIALGCMSFGDPDRGVSQWSLREEQAGPFFAQAVELGITFWDTANVYNYGSWRRSRHNFSLPARPATSAMWAWQFAKMQHAADLGGWTRFVAMQDQYNLMQREEEREMFGLLADQGVGSIPFSPLAKGRLARLADAVATLDVHLTDDEIRILEEPYGPHLPSALLTSGAGTSVLPWLQSDHPNTGPHPPGERRWAKVGSGPESRRRHRRNSAPPSRNPSRSTICRAP